jgi:hypothetical protein
MKLVPNAMPMAGCWVNAGRLLTLRVAAPSPRASPGRGIVVPADAANAATEASEPMAELVLTQPSGDFSVVAAKGKPAPIASYLASLPSTNARRAVLGRLIQVAAFHAFLLPWQHLR